MAGWSDDKLVKYYRFYWREVDSFEELRLMLSRTSAALREYLRRGGSWDQAKEIFRKEEQ